MIEVRNLTKAYGNQTILNRISFGMNAGEVIALIGPSGSGKSTLVRCLSLLEAPTEGEIFVSGVRVEANRSKGMFKNHASQVGMVFQNFNLFPHLSVIQNLIYAPVCKKLLTQDVALAKAEDLLSQAGLGHRSLSSPKTLSGGEKQRVAIMRALMLDPQILFLDEPTSALDPKRTEELVKLIRALSQKGLTVFIVTHEMNLITQLSPRVLTLENGALSEQVGLCAQISH